MAVNEDRDVLDPLAGEMAEDVDTLVRCLLSQFSHISMERLHELAFLSEYKYFYDFGDRITDADYEPALNSVYSAHIQTAVNQIIEDDEGLEMREVRIAGETVPTLKIDGSFQCNIEDEKKGVIDYIAEEFGEFTPGDMDGVLQGLPPYQEASIGEVIRLE